MQFNFTEKWYEKAVKLEGNSNVSAGIPRKFAGLRISGEDLRLFVDTLYGPSNPKSVRLMSYPVMEVDMKGEFIKEHYNDSPDSSIIQASTKHLPEEIYNIIDIIKFIVDKSGGGIPTRIYLRSIFDDEKTGKRCARYAAHISRSELI